MPDAGARMPRVGARGWIFIPRSLRKMPSGLKFWARKSRGLIRRPPTSADVGCHIVRTGEPARTFKPEGRFRSERDQKIQPCQEWGVGGRRAAHDEARLPDDPAARARRGVCPMSTLFTIRITAQAPHLERTGTPFVRRPRFRACVLAIIGLRIRHVGTRERGPSFHVPSKADRIGFELVLG
jgi:hypothetical protein